MQPFDFDLLKKGKQFLKGHVVYRGDKAIAILCPAIAFSSAKKQLRIYGKKKDAILEDFCTAEEVWEALHLTSSLLYGSPSECKEVARLLATDLLSRTMSYLTILFDDCKSLLQGFKEFQNSHIVLFGCGGIGSLTAVTLAGMGIRKLTVSDGDVIEKSNLNRQLFFRAADVGKYKVDVLEKEISARFEKVKLKTVKEFTSEQLLQRYFKNCSLAILTADEPMNIFYTAVDYCRKQKIPLISCGYFVDRARVTVIGHNNSIRSSTRYFRHPGSIAPSYGPTNMELAGIVASMALHVILGKIKPRQQHFMNWSTTEFPRKVIQQWKN